MKVTRRAIKKIRKAAKAQLKKERRQRRQIEKKHYGVVDLDSEKTALRMEMDDACRHVFRTGEGVIPERYESDGGRA